ncbi:dihydrodipicolinate synthase family protein [Pelagibacterium montanilacus]|uniref:dihydrodipicolinate synthase family protein n=1 Tax=Pelagibacterium montanilacus TaxID=2185280 RepID=UPI000F8DF73F|nr:dihydrodipicolinate synthase family protein [Pelagibacterium montanilacus]
MTKTYFSGLLVPAITPFTADLSVDLDAYVDVCKWLLANGADGLAVMGTTSEANSLSLFERRKALETLVEAGIPAEKLMPGVGTSAFNDTIDLTRHALELGCGGVLSLPPFYYKPVSSDGLYAWYARVIDTIASDDLGLWLYHIPQISGVGIPHDLIERLIADYPDTVLGIKDSSGDWDNLEAMLKRFKGFRIFPSSEGTIVKSGALGGAGCISASGNINPHGIRALLDALGTPGADALQAKVGAVRSTYAKYPLIPAAKTMLARGLGDARLEAVRPPLTALSPEQADTLHGELKAVGWSLPAR